MVWTEYTDPSGSGWRATFVEGVVDYELVEKAVRDRHPEADAEKAKLDNVAEVGSIARRGFHREMARQGTLPSVSCDFFVLRSAVRAGDHRGSGCCTEYINLLQIENGCPQYRECMTNTATSLWLGYRHLTDHEERESYRSWASELLDDFLVPYVAPCMASEDRMRSHGFQCSRE